ncbi:MAG: MBL fold metallo-hydrolase, partial [Bacillota bacterium]|nr:MBL fold metallo-hydrolase [Bacillota bacterium]
MARLQRVTDHLWRVGLPSYTLPPHGVTYSYLWGKNRLALLDVGSLPGEGHLLLEAVVELGWPVETIFLSHHHPDHVAGL